MEAGTRIVQMGYAADGDVDEIVNSAQAEVYAVTEQRTSEDYAPSPTSWKAPSTKSRPSAPATARCPASPPASPTSTPSPTASTRAR
ncbi:hypothetical protein ACU686_23555 [Yinghuangia aomiensis]